MMQEMCPDLSYSYQKRTIAALILSGQHFFMAENASNCLV